VKIRKGQLEDLKCFFFIVCDSSLGSGRFLAQVGARIQNKTIDTLISFYLSSKYSIKSSMKEVLCNEETSNPWFDFSPKLATYLLQDLMVSHSLSLN
jgi:hypothetical protein